MTDNQIKECLSESFLRLILARNRYLVSKPEVDIGVDLEVVPVNIITQATGKVTYNHADRPLYVQLKCTTNKGVKSKKGFIEYNLRVKNYRDLKGKADSIYTKMILVILVLPDDQSTWIKVLNDEMLFKKQCYWYIPEDSVIPPAYLHKKDDSKVKILIPDSNHLLEDFNSIYHKVYA